MAVHKRLAPRVRGAERTLKHLQRAIRLRRLYFEGHPSVREAAEGAHAALERFHKQFGALEVELTPRGVFYGGARIVMESAQSSDMGMLLHAEGIEVLAFERGAGLDELLGFVEALATAPAPSESQAETCFEEDLLSALWRRDFRNIHYKVIDPLSPASLQASLGDEELGSVAARIQSLTRSLAGGGEALVEVSTESFLEELDALREAGELDDEVSWETKDHHAKRLEEVSPERAALLGRVSDHDALLERALATLTWSCRDGAGADVHGPCAPASSDLVRFFSGATGHVLLRGQLERASGIVSQSELVDDPERLVSEPVKDELGSERGVRRFMRSLERSLGNGAEAERVLDASRTYLGGLGGSPLDSLCAAYPSVTLKPVRELVQTYLREHVATAPESIANLTTHRDPLVIRAGAELLASGGRDSAAFTLLVEASRDTGHARAPIAQSLVDELTGEKERRELLETVAEGFDENMRRIALARLREIPSPSAFAPLEALVSQPSFLSRSREEQEDLLDTLVQIGGVRAVKLLERLRRQRTWIFRRKTTRRLARRADELLTCLRER